MHFARLVKQASGFSNLFVILELTWCIVQCRLALSEPFVNEGPARADHKLDCPVRVRGLVGSYVWWQHTYVSTDFDSPIGCHVTAELSSLRQLTNDASGHQFLVQMPKAKVS